MMYSAVRHILILLLLTITAASFAEERLKNLEVRVTLLQNGDARITEVREMTVGSNGTECYIVVENLNGSDVCDVYATDETGIAYQRVIPWNINASRSVKKRCIGTIETSRGKEICWGIGDEGDHTYTVTYTVTSLVRAYDDADGFNYMFVAEHLKPSAEHARVIINKESGPFTEDDVKMWAFRFKGDVHLIDGSVVAETEDGLDYKHAIIVMLQFTKGVFQPGKSEEGSFDAVRERAFEGSDYGNQTLGDWLQEIAVWFLFGAAMLFIPFLFLWSYFKTWRFRRAVNKDLMWWRDLPFNGNLLRTNQVLDGMRYRGRNTKNYISACVLRLVSVGALRIEPTGKGGAEEIVIGDLKRVRGLADTSSLRKLHRIFCQAAADDGILQPKELKKWMKSHRDEVASFAAEAMERIEYKVLRQNMKEARHVMGLKQFLKDFTLANERHAVEVELWKDYLVYAELFGIAKQVRRDMERINPDYFKMDEVLMVMTNRTSLPTLLNLTIDLSWVVAKYIEKKQRDSGGGGSASMGGGGGHSGGGSGGGIR